MENPIRIGCVDDRCGALQAATSNTHTNVFVSRDIGVLLYQID
jgi:hypothetical protein